MGEFGVSHLECVVCGKHFPATPDASTCPECPKDVTRPAILDIVYSSDFHDVHRIPLEYLLFPDRHAGLWAYEYLLPVRPEASRLTLGEGHTPLIALPRPGSALGIRSLWLKNECQSPTGSLKDRVAPVVVAKALEAKAKALVVISSGNMANSVAAYGAAHGLKTIVIMSPSARPERVLQSTVLGATVLRVRGSSADRIDLCNEAAAHFGWYNATSPYNPYGSHGAKTIAYELFAREVQFDWIIFPVGFGCNIVGVWKGFKDLVEFGYVSQLPKFAAVQPLGSPSVVKAFELGLDEAVPGPQETIAGGISQVATPNSRLVLQALRHTKGTAVAVSDEELVHSVSLLAEKTGIFAEPAGAAALAGLVRLVKDGRIGKSDNVLLMITGSGHKEPIASPRIGTLDFREIDPSLREVEAILPREILSPAGSAE